MWLKSISVYIITSLLPPTLDVRTHVQSTVWCLHSSIFIHITTSYSTAHMYGAQLSLLLCVYRKQHSTQHAHKLTCLRLGRSMGCPSREGGGDHPWRENSTVKCFSFSSHFRYARSRDLPLPSQQMRCRVSESSKILDLWSHGERLCQALP